MIKHTIIAVLAGLAMSLAPSAEARKGQAQQDIDFGSITCSEFINDVANASEEDAGAVLLWLDGYLSGVSGDTTLRWDNMSDFAEQLMARCQQRGNERLLDAAKRVGLS